MDIRVPSTAGVIHAIWIFPVVSFSSLKTFTAHRRQEPTDPIAGCQQKYGRSKPFSSATSSMLVFSRASYSVPSIYTLGIIALSYQSSVISALRGKSDNRSMTQPSARNSSTLNTRQFLLVSASARADVLGKLLRKGLYGTHQREHCACGEGAE